MNLNLNSKLKKIELSSKLFKLVVYLLLIGLAFVFIYPFLSMLIDSIKSYSDISNNTVKWLPRNPTFSNYVLGFDALNVFRTFINSFVVTTLTTVGHVISCSVVAYGFARFKFPLKNLLFGIVVLSILIPTQTIIIPLYTTWSNFKLTDTVVPMILPTLFGFGLRGGIFIFLFRQFFLRIPKSLEEAAQIDGCGPFKTFIKVVFPSTGATLIVCVLLSIVWHYNDAYEPSIYLSSFDNYMLPQMLSMLSSQLSNMQTALLGGEMAELGSQILYHRGVVMAATTICLLPLFVVYILLQRKFIAGVERSGLTGE